MAFIVGVSVCKRALGSVFSIEKKSETRCRCTWKHLQ